MAVTVAGGIALAATVVLGLLLARALDPAAYGQTNVLLNEFLILNLVSGFGLTVGATAAAAKLQVGSGQDEWDVLHLLRFTTLVCPLAAGAIWSVVQADPLHLVVGLAVCGFMVQDFYIGSLQGTGRFGAASTIVAFQPLLFVGAVGGALLAGTASPALVVWALFASNAVAAGLGAALVAMGQDSFLPQRRTTWPQARQRIALNLAFQVITFLQYGFVSLPIVVIGNAGQYAEAGLLSIVLTLVRLVLVFLGPVLTGFYYARTCQLVERGDRSQLRQSFQLTARLATLAGLAWAVGLAAFPTLAIGTLYGSSYLDASSLLVVMMPLAPLLALDSVLTWTLIAERRAGTVIVALGLRLAIGLGATLVAALSAAPRLDVLGIGYDIATVVGLFVQMLALTPTIGVRSYGPRLAVALTFSITLIGVLRRFVGQDHVSLIEAALLVASASLAVAVVCLADRGTARWLVGQAWRRKNR
jgi:O-antigen/teichoic acid export membrane protein